MKQKPPLLIILGPTATGKSALAIKLAAESNGEIISADSMQVYQGMDIGTAKPSKESLESVPHHLINIINPDEPWSVADFLEQANKLIAEILKRGKLPIIVGGTGLYLNSFLLGFSFPITPAKPKIRSRLEALANEKGNEFLWEKLNSIDPKTAKRLSVNDKKRIIRALEVYESTGKPISKLQKKSPIKDEYNLILIGLNMEREKLYENINRRVQDMLERGLIKEVRYLFKSGYNKTLPSMQALGYKEVIDYLEGKTDFKETVELIKKRTRNFARRQMTWFRRFDGVTWFEGGDNADHKKIISFMKNKLKLMGICRNSLEFVETRLHKQ